MAVYPTQLTELAPTRGSRRRVGVVVVSAPGRDRREAELPVRELGVGPPG
jgi:hypothetical protein